MPSRERNWPSDRGQATALVASMLFVLMLFVAVVANVGQAVNRRIALQIVADAGAYTGASVMATGMNQLARSNRMMQYAWLLFTEPPIVNPMYEAFQIHFTSCNAADVEEGLYYGGMAVLQSLYKFENIGYSFLARSEAMSSSNFNANDLFPGERLQYGESDLPEILAGHSFGQIAETEEVPDGTMPKAIPFLKYIPFGDILLVSATKTLTYACADLIPPRAEILPPRTRTYPVWYRKKRDVNSFVKNSGVDSFVWVVTAPATSALMFDEWFGGPNVIPEMKAVAVAKPLGGDIEEGRAEYIAKMMPVATVMTGNRFAASFLPGWLSGWTTENVGRVSDPNYDRGSRIVTH